MESVTKETMRKLFPSFMLFVVLCFMSPKNTFGEGVRIKCEGDGESPSSYEGFLDLDNKLFRLYQFDMRFYMEFGGREFKVTKDNGEYIEGFRYNKEFWKEMFYLHRFSGRFQLKYDCSHENITKNEKCKTKPFPIYYCEKYNRKF
jgi:hypothetical protein